MNAFVVGCPECPAPAGQRCWIGNDRIPNEDGNAVHAARRDAARIRTAVHGTCSDCGRLMLQMTEPDETRHATEDAEGPIPPCPPHPVSDTPGVHEYVPAGVDQFVRSAEQPEPPEDQPNPPPPLDLPLPPAIPSGPPAGSCPECTAGKCINCDGQAWDTKADEPTTCPCAVREHRA